MTTAPGEGRGTSNEDTVGEIAYCESGQNAQGDII